MKSQNRSQLNRPSDTLVQYSLRSLVSGVIFIGVVGAVSEPLIRSLPIKHQAPLTQAILVTGVLAFLGMVVLWTWRWRLELKSGASIYLGRGLPVWVSSIFYFLFIGILAGMLACNFRLLPSAMALLDQGEKNFFLMIAVALFAVPMLGIVYASTLLMWRITPMTLELRDHGIIMGGFRFIPWSKVDKTEWTDGKHGTLLTVHAAGKIHKALVRNEHRQRVKEVLRERQRISDS